MKRYEKYKPSGVEWIGEIPKHWETNKLKYRDDVIMGQAPSSDDYNYSGIGLPFIQGNAEFKKLHPEHRLWCEAANKVAIADDILVSVRAPIGAVNIADQKIGIGRGLCAIRAKQDICKFLYYYFLILNEELNSIGTGSTYTAISAEEVKNVFLITPPPSEQTAIASFLDEKTAQIDTLLENKQKLIELLKEERTAIINHAVTKGVNSKAKLKPSGIEWLGDMPQHWEVKKLKHIKAQIPNSFVDGPFGSNLKSIHFVEDGDVYVVESGFITSGRFVMKKFKTITKEHFETIKRSACKGDDIIIAKIGANYGMSGILPELDKEAVVSGNSLKLTVSEKHDRKFIHFSLSNLKVRGAFDLIVNSTAQPALSLGELNDLALAVPPLEEQAFIVSYIETETQKIDAAISKIEKEIELLQEYRTALISEVVTGKIKVI